MDKLGAVSIDVDGLHHYARIHGRSEFDLDAHAKRAVAEKAIPRFLELMEGIQGTLFVIGEDLREASFAASISTAAEAGHELGSHSFAHDYTMSRKPRRLIAEDLANAHQALSRIGVPPVGFRAPGYTLSANLLQEVAAKGYQYDSSAFASTPYFAAKALVMGWLALRGRPSRSILDTTAVLQSPREPYHPDLQSPYRRGQASLLELPISVAPVTRLPFIGTLISTLPTSVTRAVQASLRATPLLNLELHAIDFLDASDGVPKWLEKAQPDVRVPVSEKMRRFKHVVRAMASERQLLPLAQAARRLAVLP